MIFTDRSVHVRPMVIESMPSPNRANATALAERQVKVEIQSEEDIAVLVHLRSRLEATIQQMLAADAVMHRIGSRIPIDVVAVFEEATTERQIAERDEKLRNVNRGIWYSLGSAIHFAAETAGDIPGGSATPFNASLVLQARQVIYEIDRALTAYSEALKEQT